MGIAGGAGDEIGTSVANLLSIGVVVYVTKAISNLAEQLGNKQMAGRGMTINLIYIILMLVAVGTRIASTFFAKDPTSATILVVLAVISGIASAVAYIAYLIYLGKTKKMLREDA